MDSTTRTKADVQAEIDALREEGKDRRHKPLRDLEAELEAMGSKPAPAQAASGHFAPDLTPRGAGKATTYWLGILPGAPVQHVTVGGIGFPLFTGQSMVIEDKNRKRRVARGEVDKDDKRPYTYLPSNHQKGEVIELLPHQVEDIKKNLKRKAVSWRDHDHTIGYVFNVDSPRGVRLRGDEEPLSRYVFMRKQRHAETEWPAPIEQTGIEEPDAG